MNPEWRNKLALLHRRINDNDVSATDSDSRDRLHFMREDQSMRPLSFKEDSVALLDPVLSFYGSAREGSPFKDDASIRDRAPFRQTSQFKHAVSMMDESEMDNDFTLSVQDCQDDSADNVNQGTPTKKGDNSGSSTRSTPSSGARSNLFNPDYTAGTQSSFTGHGYIRGVSDSRVIDYDPYLKAVEEHSYMSDNSGDGLGRNVIKTLDFGDSVEYHHDDLSIISDNDNKTNASGIGSRAVVSPHMSTPPRTAVAAIGHDALGASPPPGLGSRRAPELKPPSASSPASPDIRGNSSFNKTPSRIPMPSSRGAHSGKRVSPTQERSTSQFADALKRHGNDMGVDSEADIVAPLHMSKTVSLLPSRMHLTPQSKVSMGRADATPGTVSGAKPPTPAPTPLQLPPSRFASDAYLAQGVRVDERATQGHQDLNARNVRSDMTAFTEGFDEWKEAWTPVGKKYYYNRRTRKSAWRLPASAIQVKVHGEADKIFVPQEKDIANRDDCTSMNIIDFGPSASNLSAAGIKSVVDPLAETVATGPASHVLRNRTDAVATKPTHQANPELPERNDSPDWGNSRQIFRVDMGSGALKPEDPLEVALTTPAITERPPPSMASTTPYAEQRTGSDITTGESSAKEVVSAMKCKTLLFCPLCADVILPQRFGSHFKECPEIETLKKNGECSIVLSALSEGFAIFSKQMRSAQTKENTEVSSRPPAVAIVRPRRPDTSPMPNRVLDFGESNVNNDEIVPIPAKSEPEYKHDATESIRSKSVNTGSAAAAHNKCAFCGKPSSKSALSAHLLVCKSRKEMQMKRQASIQNDAASRGNVSAGKSRVAIIHRKINSGGTPKREARKSVTSAPAKEQIESDRQTTRIWGSLTPDDMTLGERLLQTSNRENRNDFISPAGVGDGINSAGRPAVGVVKNAALSIARKPHYSSPVKGVTRSNSAQRSHVKALGEHQSNIETPNRAITTRVFM